MPAPRRILTASLKLSSLTTLVRAEVARYLDGYAPPSSTPSYLRRLIDVGEPRQEFWATIEAPGVVPTDSVSAWISAEPPPGKDADEVEMDVVNVWIQAGTGELNVRVTGLTGYIEGQFYIDALVLKGG